MRFVIVRRRIAVGTTPGIKYLARIFRNEPIEFDRIAGEIADITTVSEPDIMAVLMSLEKVIKRHTIDGTTVKLGALGYFEPTISAKAVDTPDEVTIDTIRSLGVNFCPSVKFRKELKDAKAKFVNLDIKGLYTPEEEIIP
jgi:predicted histone-like DNA-binding protein